jgi:hypothetical protein
MTTWASWCGRHWILTGAAMMMIALFTGMIPSSRNIIAELASRPEVNTAFQDPAFGSQDAMLFLISFLFLGPFAGFVGFLLAVVILAALGGIFVPLGSRVGLPEWFSTSAFLIALGTFIYVKADIWMPPSLWFLGLVAKSWIIVRS